MLMSLQIENIAVIEKADIDFDAGFNVLTGETGAGKSIIIDAINAALGERVNREIIRSGSNQADVTAIFSDISRSITDSLQEMGIETEEDGTLLIRRSITAEGKGVCRINGRQVTVSMLREIGRRLVNIHGQHENQALLSAEKHVEYLDRLGGLLPLRAEYETAYRSMCDIRSRLKDADMDEAMKARRLDLLRYQIDEIEAAQLQPGEAEMLMAERKMFRNAEKIADSLLLARTLLSGGEESAGSLAALSEAASALQDAGRYMEDARRIADLVENVLCDLEECAGELRDMTEHLEFDPGELDRIEMRLDTIHRLTAKYGADEQEVLAFLEEARQELDAIETSDKLVARLSRQLSEAERSTREKANRLTQARRRAAARFSREVMEQLAFLDMPGVRLEVSIVEAPFSSTGADRVEFCISTNPGEPVKPIVKIASGGELSRIMLAIKSVMADADDIDTLIFDEIDTGISGRAAQKVGVKLRETAGGSIGRRRQVLCVTHLAQIAAQAHNHLLIEKTVRGDRTFTRIESLDREGREKELARIISGEVTQANLQAAREMLDRVVES